MKLGSLILICAWSGMIWADVESPHMQSVITLELPPEGQENVEKKGVVNDETPSPEVNYLTFEEAAHFALNENYELKSIRATSEARRYRSKKALSPDNPIVSFNKNGVLGMRPSAMGAVESYQIQFNLGFPGKALAASAAERHQSDRLRAQALSKEIEILTRLSDVYVSLVINQRVTEFLKEEERRAKNLLQIIEKRFTAGQAGKVDLLNMKVVISRFQQDILTNKNEKKKLITEFLNLIRKPGSLLYLPVIAEDLAEPELNEDYDVLSEVMKRNQPDLQMARQQVESYEALLKGAYLSAAPDFQLLAGVNTYNIAYAQNIGGVNRDYSFGIGMTVPIFFPLNEFNGIQAARRDAYSAKSLERNQRLQSMGDLRSLYITFKTLEQEIRNLKDVVIPASKTIYELVSLNYSLNKTDYFRLNDARSTWVTVRIELSRKRLQRAQIFNSIVKQVGCDFKNKGGSHECL